MADTTAAGDCFTGVLAAALDRGLSIAEALRRANLAAALCCTRVGTQASLPTRSRSTRCSTNRRNRRRRSRRSGIRGYGFAVRGKTHALPASVASANLFRALVSISEGWTFQIVWRASGDASRSLLRKPE